jgi:glutamine synthetase
VNAVDAQQRAERADRARRLAEQLAEHDVVAVAITFVDLAGITRVKGVPVAAFERAAAWGVGATPVFDAFGFDDSIAACPAANPCGDLRLLPDLDRVVPLAGQPGWAWAPADRWSQDGQPHPRCGRLLAARLVERLAEAGLAARMGFEVEFVLHDRSAPDAADGALVPACAGPAYGMTRLIEVSDFATALLRALSAEEVAVAQFHPEYAPGQFELSAVPESPVPAADTAVLVRSTIRAVAARHGLACSFAPAVIPGGVGNGGHVHLSLHRGESNLFAGGPGRHGLHPEAEAFAAGILARLPALLAIGAPSVAGYQRLLPSHWSGAFACWGLENREAALRLVTGSTGESEHAANLEVKCFDQAANPYLLVAALLACGLAGISEQARLPQAVQQDPAAWSPGERDALGVARLPERLDEAVAAFAADPVLTGALGRDLTETIVAVRRAEIAAFADAGAEQILAATRWKY